jgi:hypothetical protein
MDGVDDVDPERKRDIALSILFSRQILKNAAEPLPKNPR